MAIIEALAALVAPLVAEAATAIQRRFEAQRPDYQINISDSLAAVSAHLLYADRWVGEVRIADLPKPRTLRDIFVELDLNLTPRRHRLDTEWPRTLSLTSLSTTPRHSVILGDPGAGKTTSLKRLCQLAIESVAKGESKRMILLAVLRDLGDGESLTDRILNDLGVGLAFSPTVNLAVQSETKRRIMVSFLGKLPTYLFVDGLDEVSHSVRSQVEADLRSILERADNVRVILTTRSADYQFNLPNSDVYELEGLTQTQVEEFARKWLRRHEDAAHFLQELRKSPYADTVFRPLTLSHICAIYSRTGQIPEKPKTIYRKIVYLLLKEWDEQKSVRRISDYSQFEADRKQEFLEHLSFYITRAWQLTRFDHELLYEAYEALAPAHGLPKNQAAEVAREIESHTGLIVQSGYDRFEFAHKSLQEYLAAEYIVKYPEMPTDGSLLSTLPNELAIAVALSSAPSVFLSKLLEGMILWQEDATIAGASNMRSAQTFFYRLNQERPNFGYDERLSASLLRFGQTLGMTLSTIAERRARAHGKFGGDMPEFKLFEEAISAVTQSLVSLGQHEVVAELLSDARNYYHSERIGGDVRLRRQARLLASEDRPIPTYMPKDLTLPHELGAQWGFVTETPQ